MVLLACRYCTGEDTEINHESDTEIRVQNIWENIRGTEFIQRSLTGDITIM